MSPEARPVGSRALRPRAVAHSALRLSLAGLVLIAPQVVMSRFGLVYGAVAWVLAFGGTAVFRVCQARRRGQTVREAIAASRADRRRLIERRERVKQAKAALPWMREKGLRPGTVPGVLVAPEPAVPGYYTPGHDVVIDSAGEQKLGVALEVMKLTRLSPQEARVLVERAPVPVLRVPDLVMAEAARSILEAAGAAVSVTAPAS